MAIGLARKLRLTSRRKIHQVIRTKSGKAKRKARARREVRLLAAIKANPDVKTLPAGIQSQLSLKVGKRSTKITAADVAKLI